MPHYYFDTINIEIFITDEEDPNQFGRHFTDAESLAKSEVPHRQMIQWFMKKTGRHTKKFATRYDGAKRIMRILTGEEAIPEVELTSARRGTVSKYSGRVFVPITPLNKDGRPSNPRRPDSHGWRSFNLFVVHGELVYEDYIAKGGRSNDLEWDLNHKFVAFKSELEAEKE